MTNKQAPVKEWPKLSNKWPTPSRMITARFDTESVDDRIMVKLYINERLYDYDTIDPSWPFYDTRMAMMKKQLLKSITSKLYRFGYLLLTDPPK